MQYKRMAIAVVAAFAATLANAELVRCTSKSGASVIRRDKCDSPDDVRMPVTAKSPIGGSAGLPPAATQAEAMSAYNAQDYARARAFFEPRAQQGDATAQIIMGDMYKNGRGVPKDEAAGYAWTRKAADQGDARGQTGVAALMQAGRGTPKDDAGAIAWLEKAAKQGYPLGQAALGSAYLEGRGVAKDEMRGMQWLEKAAGGGIANVQTLLGLAYYEGQPKGWPKDREKAVFWLRKAAAQGDTDAIQALKTVGR